jgi:hypothetical protein
MYIRVCVCVCMYVCIYIYIIQSPMRIEFSAKISFLVLKYFMISRLARLWGFPSFVL